LRSNLSADILEVFWSNEQILFLAVTE
jgi:hypothetical protein